MLCKGGEVLVKDLPLAADLLGDVHLPVEVVYCGDEGVCLVCDSGALDTDKVGKFSQLLVRGFSIGAKHDGEQDGVGKAVRDAVEAAKRVRKSMHGAHVGAGERETCAIGSVLHIQTGLFIVAVFIGFDKVFKHKFDRDAGVFLGAAGICAADIRFDRVGQGVHTRGGGDGFGQVIGKSGVQNRIVRDQVQIVHQIFVARFGVGDDRRNGDFAAGARRGGDRKQGRDVLFDLQQPFHLGKGALGVGNLRAAAFGAVHRGTAADGDQAVAAVLRIKLVRGGNVVHSGIGHRFAVDRVRNAEAIHLIGQGRIDADAVKVAIRHDQGALEAKLSEFGGNVLQATGSGDQLGLTPRHQRKADVHEFLVDPAERFALIDTHDNTLLFKNSG